MRTGTPFTVLLLLVFSLPAYGESPYPKPLKGDPVAPEATIVIDLPEDVAPNKAREAAGELVTHWRSVPNIYTGQRIALPTNALDGSCRDDVLVTVDGSSADRVEFDPDGRHWYQHKIQTRVITGIDSDNCELVIDLAVGADRVKRRQFKHKPPPGFAESFSGSPLLVPLSRSSQRRLGHRNCSRFGPGCPSRSSPRFTERTLPKLGARGVLNRFEFHHEDVFRRHSLDGRTSAAPPLYADSFGSRDPVRR